MPWPTFKTVNELVFYSSFYVVNCVLCILYRVFYIVSYAYAVHLSY